MFSAFYIILVSRIFHCFLRIKYSRESKGTNTKNIFQELNTLFLPLSLRRLCCTFLYKINICIYTRACVLNTGIDKNLVSRNYVRLLTYILSIMILHLALSFFLCPPPPPVWRELFCFGFMKTYSHIRWIKHCSIFFWLVATHRPRTVQPSVRQ